MKFLIWVASRFVGFLTMAILIGLVPVLGKESEDPAADRQAAEDLMEALGWKERLQEQVGGHHGVAEQVSAAGGLDKDLREALREELEAGLEEIWEGLDWSEVEAAVVAAYSESYTREEMVQLTEFFSSPLGEKYLATHRLVEEAAMEPLARQLRERQPLLEKRLRAFLEEKVFPDHDHHQHHHHDHHQEKKKEDSGESKKDAPEAKDK